MAARAPVPCLLWAPLLAALAASPWAAARGSRAEEPAVGSQAAPVSGTFTLVPPDPTWRELRAGELREFGSKAIAGLAGSGTVRCALSGEASRRADLEAVAREILSGQGLDRPSQGFLEPTDILNRPAVHGLVTGKRDRQWWRYHVLVFREQGDLYWLLSRGMGEEVPADGSKFLEAAEGLRFRQGASPAQLAPIRVAPDAAGVGWRLRGGTYRNAALGFELAPRGPWRVGLGPEFAVLGPEVLAGMVDEHLNAYVGAVVERLPGVDAEKHMEKLRRAQTQVGHSTGSRKVRIGTREVELKLQTVASISGDVGDTEIRASTVYFEDERCVQLILRYPAPVDRQLAEVLPQAFSSLRLMDEAERARLSSEMLAEPDRTEVVGESSALRKGTYSDFRFGFRWRSPAGFWELDSDPRGSGDAPQAVLWLRERGLAVEGGIFASKAGADETTPTRHAAELARLFGSGTRVRTSSPFEVELGEARGLASWCDPGDGSELRHLVVTCVARQQATVLTLAGPRQAMERNESALLQSLKTLEISLVPLAPNTMAGGVYRDRRMGFELERPAPQWRFSERRVDRFGPRMAAAQGVLAGFEGPGKSGFFAAAIWSPAVPAEPEGSIEALLPTAFLHLSGLPDDRPQTDTAVTFGGRRGRLLSWSEEGRRVELLLLVRDSTLFAVSAASGPQDPAPRDRMAGFRLLD